MATITLTITDNQNGTGATATVAGGQGTATNQIYVQPYSAGVTGASFALAGTLTGPGSVQLPLAPGSYYWAYCQSTGHAPAEVDYSNFVPFPVSQNADSVWWRCLEAAQAVVQGLLLTGQPPSKGIPANQVYLQKTFDDSALQFPCVLLMPPQSGEKFSYATNVMDDVSYPVWIGILDRQPAKWQKDLQQELNWRQQLQRAFRNQRLATVPEIWKTDITFNPAIDPKHPLMTYLVNSFVLWFVSREIRGT